MMALAGALALASPPQDRDDQHDNGKHKGQEKHGGDDRGDRGDRHDNGKHRGWDNPHNPHANWDYDHDRIKPGRVYFYGRYEHVRGEFIARGIDTARAAWFFTTIRTGWWLPTT